MAEKEVLLRPCQKDHQKLFRFFNWIEIGLAILKVGVYPNTHYIFGEKLILGKLFHSHGQRCRSQTAEIRTRRALGPAGS
jgi:hypothetical protein